MPKGVHKHNVMLIATMLFISTVVGVLALSVTKGILVGEYRKGFQRSFIVS